MAHTLEDYSTKYKLAKVFSNVDDAELAARTSQYTSVDRRGNVVWYDDFESAAAIKWFVTNTGGGTATLSTTRAYHGNQSMKISTGAVLGDDVTMEKTFSLPLSRRIGAEALFNILTVNALIELRIMGYSGTRLYFSQFRYDQSLLSLQYLNSAGAWVDLTIYDGVSLTQEQWIPMKLVVDWDTGEYVRVIFGGTEYSLSGEKMFSAPSATKRRIRTYIYVQTDGAVVSDVYVDNFILTQNE